MKRASAILLLAAAPALANTDGRPARAPAGVADLAVRQGCTWQRPGADPWQSTPARDRAALLALGVPPEHIDAALRRMAGPPDDRAMIGRRVELVSGEAVEDRFDMTFGRAVCRNVVAGFDRREAAPVWHVAPGVWIAKPIVCGNLSRLHPVGTIPPAPARPAPPVATDAPGFYPPPGFVPPLSPPDAPWPIGPAPWAPWALPPITPPAVPPVWVDVPRPPPVWVEVPVHRVPAPSSVALVAAGVAALLLAKGRG